MADFANRHPDYIRAIVVHPTLSVVLTASDDMTIRMFDWEKEWKCVREFVGHQHYVMGLSINPKDTNVFASACLDRTIKIWSIDNATAKQTIEAHEKESTILIIIPTVTSPTSSAHLMTRRSRSGTILPRLSLRPWKDTQAMSALHATTPNCQSLYLGRKTEPSRSGTPTPIDWNNPSVTVWKERGVSLINEASKVLPWDLMTVLWLSRWAGKNLLFPWMGPAN